MRNNKLKITFLAASILIATPIAQGRAAESSTSQETLQRYIAQLKASPNDHALREKIIEFLLTLQLEHPLDDKQAFIKNLNGSRYIHKDTAHGLRLTLDIRNNQIIEGIVDAEEYGGLPNKMSSAPLTGREFFLPKRSWCQHGFHCDATGVISEDGQTITLKRVQSPGEGGKEVVLIYQREERKGLLFGKE